MEVQRWATWACSTRFLTAMAGDGRSPRRVAFSTPPERGVLWRPGVVWNGPAAAAVGEGSGSMLAVGPVVEDTKGNSRAVTPVYVMEEEDIGEIRGEWNRRRQEREWRFFKG